MGKIHVKSLSSSSGDSGFFPRFRRARGKLQLRKNSFAREAAFAFSEGRPRPSPIGKRAATDKITVPKSVAFRRGSASWRYFRELAGKTIWPPLGMPTGARRSGCKLGRVCLLPGVLRRLQAECRALCARRRSVTIERSELCASRLQLGCGAVLAPRFFLLSHLYLLLNGEQVRNADTFVRACRWRQASG